MPPEPSGTIAVNEPAPYHWGDTLTFTTTGGKGRGWPMVEVTLYQDANEDGVVDEDLHGDDLVHAQLDHPDATFVIGGGFGKPDTSLPAHGQARLLQYAWKGGQQSITELDTVEISVTV